MTERECGNIQFHLGSPCIYGQSSGAYFYQSVNPYLYSTPSNHNSHERQRKSTAKTTDSNLFRNYSVSMGMISLRKAVSMNPCDVFHKEKKIKIHT